jgi:tetratricopeptide (TPR) repeat protein
MTKSNILRIEEYRDRRVQRLQLARSLYSVDPDRLALLRQIRGVAAVTGADRAAVVWVDEYGPGLVHPHVVLDLLADRPRRTFAIEPLRKAWDIGVPGTTDEVTYPGPSTVAVALGSDGTRSWFLVAESLSIRARLDDDQRDRIMFAAGECAAIVLHADLDGLLAAEQGQESAGRRFAGWPILQDLEGREENDSEGNWIGRRFIVARLARLLVDDGLTIPSERILKQVQHAREEALGDDCPAGPEVDIWVEILERLEAGQLDELAAALVSLGDLIEAEGHVHGALELYECAYEIAASTGAVIAAVDAARFAGRLSRRLAKWDDAFRWYDIARNVAEAAGQYGRVAVVLDGVANMQRERGNLPAAREALELALTHAEQSGEPDALGAMHHSFRALAQATGDYTLALSHGWKAVGTYVTPRERIRALAGLGGTLIEAGELALADDAWAVVAHQSDELYYRIYAHDARAHIAARLGDPAGFERYARACDGLDWRHGPALAKAEILYFRGLSYRWLGRMAEADRWLQEAIAFAEANGFGQIVFQAEEALDTLRTSAAREAGSATPELAEVADPEVREGLRALREEAVGAAL